MVEWHVPPDYIANHWTDELLDLMVEKLIARKGRYADRQATSPPATRVTDKEHITMLGKKIKVVNK